MKGGALNVFHGDVHHAVLLTSIVNRYDIRMVEYTGGTGLILEAAQHILGFEPVNIHTHGLQRDRTPNRGIQGLVNHTHGAAAKFRDDLVSTDSLERHDRHDSFPSCDFIERAWTLSSGGDQKL